MKCFLMFCVCCLVSGWLEGAAGLEASCGLKPAAIMAVDEKNHHHKTVSCKLCDFPCLGLSICMTPMVDPHHKHKCHHEHKHSPKHDHKHEPKNDIYDDSHSMNEYFRR